MEIRPSELETSERYKLLIGTIVPRPVALVSTVSPEGLVNLAPYSFFNGVGSNPMTIMFCPANKGDGTEKDTLRNCRPVEEGGSREFVVNEAIESYRREVAAAAEALPYGESEFELTGLGMAPSRVVRPPRVAASPVAFECRTIQVVRTNPGAPAGGNLVLGEVVHLFVDDRIIDDRFRVDPEGLRAIGRMGGWGYCTTRDRFELPPGRRALTTPDREQ